MDPPCTAYGVELADTHRERRELTPAGFVARSRRFATPLHMEKFGLRRQAGRSARAYLILLQLRNFGSLVRPSLEVP